jgi:hypothetical protein
LGHEIFGTPLPDTPLGWIGLLVAIWGALLTAISAAQAFAEYHGAPSVKTRRPCSGHALPVGWVFWSVALLSAHSDPLPVLVVLLGTAMILVAMQALRARRHG